MTKRINIGHEDYAKPTRKGGTALIPVVLLIGICTAWAGYAFERSNQSGFPARVNGVAANLLQLIDDGASEIRAFLDEYLYR
jgi:hypothetical protein